MEEFYIKKLNLNLPAENGYLDEFSSLNQIHYSAAYYLLSFPKVNPLHLLDVDESWQYCDGNPLKLHMLSVKNGYQHVTIGNNLKLGEKFIHIVPANTWMCAEVLGTKGNFTLLSHFSAPPFKFEHHHKGTFDKLIKLFPDYSDLIKKFQWK